LDNSAVNRNKRNKQNAYGNHALLALQMVEVDEPGKAVLESLEVEFPTLIFTYENSAVCVRICGRWCRLVSKECGAWVEDDYIRAILRNYVIFREIEASLLENSLNRGAYVLVNDLGSRYLHETHDSAWRARTNEHAFVGRVGDDELYDKHEQTEKVQAPLATKTAELDDQAKELLESLRNEFPILIIAYQDGAICVRVYGKWSRVVSKECGVWVEDEYIRAILPNYVVFKEVEASLLADAANRGAYVLVNDPESRFLHETFDSASRAQTNEYAFIGEVGADETTEERLPFY
jgi:hydrogenase maturation factor